MRARRLKALAASILANKPLSCSMRYLAGCVLLWLGSAPLAAPAQDVEKTWIFLTDKLDATGKATQVEPGYVSLKAMERRARRGSAAVPGHDAPISQVYLEALAQEGIRVQRQSRWLNAVTAYLTAEQRQAVRQLPFVLKIQRVAKLTTDAQQAAPMSTVVARPLSRLLDCGSSCYQLQLVNAEKPIDDGYIGTGIVVGFVDTRFDYNDVQLGHPATRHLADAERVKYRNFTSDDPGVGTQQDVSFHGLRTTAVTFGNHSGELIGPCYGADTAYVAHTEWGPLERNVEEDNFVEAVEWMESSGVDVINSSLGYTTFDDGENSYTTSDMDGDTGITTIAYDLAAEKGVIPVSSAGNSGTRSWRIISTPADGDSVIAVGAVDPDSSTTSFSSRGPTADGRTKPDVTAQGRNVYTASSLGGYSYSNGTSFSGPMVTGVVCQILQANKDLNPKEVWEVLTSTANQSASPDNDKGWGIIDADAAISEAKDRRTAVDLPDLPSTFTVQPPYPNPFTDAAHFELALSESISDLQIIVYNILGQRVLAPFDGPLSAGTHTVSIHAGGLAPGLYTYVVRGANEVQTGLMVHVR